jgi:hypothetical protein
VTSLFDSIPGEQEDAEHPGFTLRSPYQYFGGKSKVSPIVWKRLGNVRNFVEPFFGSGAMLLGRPQPFAGLETVNDADGHVSNFWRALHAAPDEVAKWAGWPVSECDLHARHLWLTNEGRQHVERLKTDAEYFDAKIAGWWVWGLCQWINAGWCAGAQGGEPFADGRLAHPRRPHLGRGVGVHRPSQQLPHLGDAGMGECERRATELREYFRLLADRLRGVRVCCGDWSRVCGPTPTVKQGLTGVFLDPPYSLSERAASLYSVEADIAAEVRAWCLERGGDERIRIALCGYDGEGHEELERHGWDVLRWKSSGGIYSNQGHRERIWFSPHCRAVQ